MDKTTVSYLWKDRKRRMGLPLSFTRYSLSDDRLFLSTGFLNVRDEEVLLYRVRDITTSRTLWQRLCGVGTITVASSDKTTPELVLKNVKHPTMVKELIHRSVEEMKIRRRVRVDELMNSGDASCHHCDCDAEETDDDPDSEI